MENVEEKVTEKVDEPKTVETKEKVTFTAEQQAYIDNLIDKRTAKITSKAEEKALSKIEEATRLANLSAEEKAVEMAKKKERDIAERERTIALKEMTYEARHQLMQEGISSNMADFLVRETADETSENIKKFKTAFEEAVERRVEERIRGGYKPTKVSGDTMTERQQLEAELAKAVKLEDKIRIKNKLQKLKE